MAVVCVFCEIVAERLDAARVFEDEASLAFLDHRPLLIGHALLVPRQHHGDFDSLPSDLVARLFRNAQLLSRAMHEALAAEGTFVAVNNRVSQSVPHVHVHIVPRQRGDGLRGFFWPRQKYGSPEAVRLIQGRIRAAVATLVESDGRDAP